MLLSRVGYPVVKLPFPPLSGKDIRRIYIAPLVRQLPEFTATGKSPASLLKELRSKIEKGRPQASFTMKGFYRQYHWENGRAVFLVEALGSIFFSAQKSKLERMNMVELRRAYPLEKNKETHADHLADLLSENPVYHDAGTILSPDDRSAYTFHLPEEKENNSLTTLQFTSEDELFITEGSLLFATEDLQLLKYKLHISLKPDAKVNFLNGGGRYVWFKQEERIEADFYWKKDSIYLSEIHQQYRHFLLDPVFHSVDFDLTEDFFWKSEEDINYTTHPGPDYTFSSNLYSRKYIYNRANWESSALVRSCPLAGNVAQSLIEKVPLENQFKEAGH
ncbi:MAG: hypothetical protein IPJ86_06490 [Bacteroidetes bacterium]|nr:hypothetical protein [Bacteroidota bacterium]